MTTAKLNTELSRSHLEELRRRHPAWRLLRADHAPVILSFLHRVFTAAGQRQIPESAFLHALDDDLRNARAEFGEDAFSRTPREYLTAWSGNECLYLRVNYQPGSDEPVVDLTVACERAIEWVVGLRARAFVGTESRLLTIVELLRQIRDGTQRDPQLRLKDLESRRAALDAQISRLQAGQVDLLTPVQVKDRFQQLAGTARALLADLREVEQNFRQLDREVRTHITQWDGSKGALLQSIFGGSAAIADSEQGRSFGAFWDFLSSADRQDEFDRLLEGALALPAIQELAPDPRLRWVQFDWQGAGEQAQRTVAMLSQQLRRFLDDRALQEHKRIIQLIHGIERTAIRLRDHPPEGTVADLAAVAADIALPMERPLHASERVTALRSDAIAMGISDDGADALFEQVHVDLDLLETHIRDCLRDRERISLAEVVALHPLREGLAELVGYLRIATAPMSPAGAEIDESRRETIRWQDRAGSSRQAGLPAIVFAR